ncbi:vitamin-D-receptor interacting mediator subunit 4-domain-containing protein [Vararia minispora EC-137]|uniref:Vitamin-D-receptor interacting mediator subunit 4-domain-containing protein n=1 Tax=Vararia minispora EC-137 TaxID=1314806 RepID=A0ACB8QU42_9AGAM|nr:vitamin-D-receptor interacting mediator subunit 4-domain-containing protein [Vararia minispora EC-137]
MTNVLLDPLNNLQSLSLLLFQSLSPPQNKPPPPPPISAFIECDATLAAALQLARVHQAKQRRIEALKDEVLELEMRWREVIGGLEEGRRALEVTIDEGEERIRAIKHAKDAAVPYTDLLAYAQHIAAFTAAPPGMPAPNTEPPPPYMLLFPPYPNEEKMQRGAMNLEKPLGPLGETRSIGRVREPTPAREPERRGYKPVDTRSIPQVFDLDLDLNPDL